jgi:hypothetical protein
MFCLDAKGAPLQAIEHQSKVKEEEQHTLCQNKFKQQQMRIIHS